MHISLPVLHVTLALCLCAAPLAAQSQPEATILDHDGIVVIQAYPGGPPVPALVAQRVPATASLRLEEGGRLLLLMPGDQLREVRGRFDTMFDKLVPAGPVPSPVLAIVQSRLGSLSSAEFAPFPAREATGAPIGEAPRDRVLPGKVPFYWTSKAPDGAHRLIIRDTAGITLFNSEVKGCSYRLPAGILTPGVTYQWLVHDEREHVSAPRSFRVLAEADAAEIERHRTELLAQTASAPPWVGALMEAAYFESSQLLDLAIERYEAAAQKAAFPAMQVGFQLAHLRLRRR
jgi:hypothetical protein